jgi:hypothetical protein
VAYLLIAPGRHGEGLWRPRGKRLVVIRTISPGHCCGKLTIIEPNGSRIVYWADISTEIYGLQGFEGDVHGWGDTVQWVKGKVIDIDITYKVNPALLTSVETEGLEAGVGQ